MILRSTPSYSQVCARTLFAGCLLTVAVGSSVAAADSSTDEPPSVVGGVNMLQASTPNASEADCDEVYLLRPSTPFATPSGAELAPIFNFTVPWGDEPRQLIGVTPVLDNKKIIGNFRIGVVSDEPAELVYVWQPGDTPPRMPEGIGQYLPSGSAARIYLRPHYRNPTGTEQVDASGARLCVVKGAHLRAHVAGMTNAFSASAPDGMQVSSNGYMVGRTCRVTAAEPVTLVTVAPTMRTSGRASIATVIPREGSRTNFDVTGFDFSNRQTKILPKPVVLQTGDVVDFSCIFAPLSQPRLFGDSLADETCVMYTTYHPHGALQCEPLRTKVDVLGRQPSAQGS